MDAKRYVLVAWRHTSRKSKLHVKVMTHDNDEQNTACGISYQVSDVLWETPRTLGEFSDAQLCQNCRRAVESLPGG